MIDVYIAALPQGEPTSPLFSNERQAEVDRVSNESARREKYYAWRLLEYAIKNSLGADASRLCFTKGKNRKWYSEGIEFSISHSAGALAVAISSNNKSVGVDVEEIRVRNIERMADYMLSPSEYAEFCTIEERFKEEWLISKWCQKEAIFKSLNEEIFAPKKIEVSRFFCNCRELLLNGKKYMLAVASAVGDDVNVIEVIDF